MADIKSPEERSRNMSRIKGKDTKPEVYIREKLYEIACDMAKKYERKGKKHGKQSTDGD